MTHPIGTAQLVRQADGTVAGTGQWCGFPFVVKGERDSEGVLRLVFLAAPGVDRAASPAHTIERKTPPGEGGAMRED